MDKLIINEFYKKILPSASSEIILIDGWNFNIGFCTNIENEIKYSNDNIYETLFINDKELFDKLLILYAKKMYEIIISSNLKKIDYVYYDGKKEYIIDFILANLWNNVTDTDLNNPIEYLKNRIRFLSDPLYDSEFTRVYLKNIPIFDESNIEYSINLNNPILETPYSFSPCISKDKTNNEFFKLPKIYYGISDNVCYIYAIKNEGENYKNSYTKKINRILYKVNKDVTDNYELENIKDVSASALISLTLFIRLLKENNIENIKVVDYMPIRYNAKSLAIKKRIDKKFNNLDNDEINKLYESGYESQDYIQSNMTNKFIRNFRRLSYQLGNLNITSYPKDVDSFMHINITDEVINKDNIINDIYNYEVNTYKKTISFVL